MDILGPFWIRTPWGWEPSPDTPPWNDDNAWGTDVPREDDVVVFPEKRNEEDAKCRP